MLHFIVFINIVALLSGVVVAFILWLLNKKYHQSMIQRYSWFHGILSLEIIYFIVVSYLTVTEIKYPIFLIHFSRILDASLIYVVPYFFHHFLSIKNEAKHQRYFFALSVSFLGFKYGLDALTMNHMILIQTYYAVVGWVDFIILVPIIYILCQSIITLRKGLCSIQTRSAIIKGLCIIILFLPGFIADVGWFHLKEMFDLIPSGFYFTSIFYFIWNGLLLHGVSDYLTVPVNSKEQFQTFCDTHQLSDREQDICSLLLNGMSNHSISKHLFIEESTVKKHLQNIFKKTNVSSRFQLTQFIRGKET